MGTRAAYRNINYDKLCHKMLKSTSLLVFWYSYSLAVSVMCDVIRLFCLRCYVFEIR